MTDNDQEQINLEPEIEKARKHYFRSRDNMRLALKEMGANEEAADKLFSLAEEFGIEHVAERLVDSGRLASKTPTPWPRAKATRASSIS